MCSRESSGNSTRLSLDAANLPITPFGMRHHGSSRKLNSPVTNRFNKLSRRRGGDPQGGTKVAEYEGGNKGNIGGLKGGQRRKRWPGGGSRDVPLYSVPEDNVAPESSCDPAGEEQRLHHSTGSQHHSTGSQHHSTGSQHHSTGSQHHSTASQHHSTASQHHSTASQHHSTASQHHSTGSHRFVSHNLPSAVYSSATNKNTQGARIDSNERRDSVFTDIDEGSFVEFCHDKGKGHGVPCIPDDPIRKTNLYYTCESNNDTQYSTSTKTNNAPVGFHKYLDKVRMQKYLGNVLEETETDAPDMKDKVNINGLYDETIITCSADMHRVLRKGPPPTAINSTVMDKLPLEARVPLPYVFLDISTLTGKPETVSDSHCQSFRGQTGEHEIVVVSESSDEGEAQSGGGGGGPTNLRQRGVHRDDSETTPFVPSGGGGGGPTNPRQRGVHRDDSETTPFVPSGGGGGGPTNPRQRGVHRDDSETTPFVPSGGGGGGPTNPRQRGVHRDDSETTPFVPSGGGGRTTVPLYSGSADYYKASRRPPSPEVVAPVAVKSASLLSEDISIVTTTPEVFGYSPQKATDTVSKNTGKNIYFGNSPQETTEVVSKNTGKIIYSGRGGRVPIIYENRKIEECGGGGGGHVTQGGGGGGGHVTQTRDLEPEKLIKQIAESPTDPVSVWVMTSPFKDSSFDSSFLQRRDEDSYIGESASQAKPSHEDESLICAIEFNHKHLTNRGVSQQKSDSKPSSKKRDSPLARKSIISSSESECEYAAKRPTGKQRVIVYTSEESGEDKRNGMFVTQRKKKKHSKITSELFESDYNEASDSEEEESLHLRLSKSHNETNKASEKTTKTVGKSATSPENRAKNFSKPPNTVSQKLKPHQSHPRRVENTDSNTPPVGIKTIHNDISCHDIRPPGNKDTTPPPETVNSPDNSDGDGPLDLSLIRKELDNLYTPAWRKKENAIFKPTPIEKMHKNRTTRPRKSFEGPNRRRSKSCPRLKLDSDEEKSVTYEVNEVRSDGDGDTSGSERHVSSENKLDPVNRDVKTTKISDKPAEDSFEEYLKKVKSLRQRNEQQQEIQSDDEDEDRYEASFINDDDSYSLPMVIQKPQKSPPVNSRNPKPKSRVRNPERHKVSLDDAVDTSNRTNEKAAKTPSRPEEDSFEEYIKKARVLTQQKKHQEKVVSSDENDDRYESSFINDGSSDDESFSLPLVAEKHFKTPSRIPDYPKHIVKKQDRGTIKTNTGTKPTTTWRDSPTVYLTSDSDSDDVYSLTKTNKKIQPPSSYVTPRTKGRGKVLPKTEGHCRHLPKKYETGQLSPRLPFLASLSSNVDIIQCHPEALPYIRNFKKKKEELVEKLYKYYNTHVFEDKLPSYMNIKWNVRLTKTAGYCYYQINRSSECGRGSRIELSTKVIDCSERLRDTLIHELCHAAAWIISGYKDGHGPLWKAWSAKARSVFPELPAISRCHSYQIQCKYTYRCKRCAYSIGRHSKSLDTQKKVCGHCFGRFELLVNSKTSRGQNRDGPSTPALDPPKIPRTPGPFALFVKENYGSVKKSTPHLKHGDVMRVLSTKFESVKTGVDSVPFSRLILD